MSAKGDRLVFKSRIWQDLQLEAGLTIIAELAGELTTVFLDDPEVFTSPRLIGRACSNSAHLT
jgi:hypothetical protein